MLLLDLSGLDFLMISLFLFNFDQEEEFLVALVGYSYSLYLDFFGRTANSLTGLEGSLPAIARMTGHHSVRVDVTKPPCRHKESIFSVVKETFINMEPGKIDASTFIIVFYPFSLCFVRGITEKREMKRVLYLSRN
ncbi:hypothetical protein DM860_015175 [Cuscuta australis]|uniref:Uncharacterized protein n=1 Tax=Cuscuta australis TaxID=267555 RepID=A0A328DBY4_9ASTE|nr:hypothetical protein DM860_015175 [Cuscuta australis]